MAIKGYSTFPKAPALLEPQHKIVLGHIQDTQDSYLSSEMQLVYSTALADWTKIGLVWFQSILTIVGYLMPNPFFTYILNIYDL